MNLIRLIAKAVKRTVTGKNNVGQVVHGLLDISPVANQSENIPVTRIRVNTQRVVFTILVIAIIAELFGIDILPYLEFANEVIQTSQGL